MKKAFTMAEVLITLTVIGVVAALTIPVLKRTFQTKHHAASHEVFITNMTDAMMNMQIDKKLMGYETTADFVKQFQNYIKIIKICDNNHLSECFDTSFYVDGKEITIDKVKTSSNLGKDYNDNNMGVVFANGVSAIITYDPDCMASDTDLKKSLNCLGMMYDINGTRNPNKAPIDIGFINANYQQSGLTVANLVNERYCTLSPPNVDCGHQTYMASDLEEAGITITGSQVSASDLFYCYCSGGCTSMDSKVTSCEIIYDD